MIGLLPTYAQIGISAPIALLVIRVLQGLALGGQYGGAAVYVAEHVPDGKRGFYTSFIQITASLGFFLSLAVILIVQNTMSPDVFAGKAGSFGGWRIPFLVSVLLVGVSLYIRMRMQESPVFEQMKSAGMTSASPLVEAFTQWKNLKIVLISLFGATAGQGVVWYTGQFLRALLPAVDLESQPDIGELHRRHRAPDGNAVLCPLWRPERSRRPQVDHPRGVLAGPFNLHSDLQRDAVRRRVECRHRSLAKGPGDRRDQTNATVV